MNSKFFEETEKFLNSKELEKMLEDYNMYLDFKLHPILERPIIYFLPDDEMFRAGMHDCRSEQKYAERMKDFFLFRITIKDREFMMR